MSIPGGWTWTANDSLCLADQTSWTSLGPAALTNGWSGRADSIVVDPDDVKTIYIGSPYGGIWKTTNGGTSWSPRSDYMPSLGISAMAMDPTNTDILYAGSTAGLYKSIDAGTSWHVFTDMTIGSRFQNLLVRYTAPDRFELYAAGNKGVWVHEGHRQVRDQGQSGHLDTYQVR